MIKLNKYLKIIILILVSFIVSVIFFVALDRLDNFFPNPYTESIHSTSVEPEINPPLVIVEKYDEFIVKARITAYSIYDPGVNCISASGKNLCYWDDLGLNMIACPTKYPIDIDIDEATKAEVLGIEYYCVDRMAKKNQSTTPERFDIWFYEDLEGANQWGIKFLEVKVKVPKK